ncbi:MAG: Cysteine desulfurase [uncultured Sphingomonas sp.]|uniref:Cysteine desulfurase n=1 Tax=uncultured Sphingomonas sp. TaxID=158754 RepID=A0A6J4TD09_9SPHN|nr:cysteine desulfurase family protein [uncultured Sphingomonas sp.]CAA9519918.1 MAG: Cysteine desulfurase [uncultured Sphingomonas sp.]
MKQRIYLDHAATTPVLPEARAAVAEAVERWANPSSPHAEGRAARALLEDMRERVRQALGWPRDVVFTSGASEAVQIAADRARTPRRAVGATEHAIVPHAMGGDASKLPVDEGGIIRLDVLDAMLAAGPALIAIQHVNNETGVIQPLDEIARRVRTAGSLLLADCAQSAGKLPLPAADFIAVAAHKLGGPPGVGALLVRDLATLEPSGGQEKGYRRGTQDVPAIAGFAAAVTCGAFARAMPHLAELRRRLEDGVRAAGGVVIAEASPRVANIGSIAMPGANRASLLVQFDLAGFAVSAGSACSSGKMQESHVLSAMGLAAEVASGALRISFGPQTSEAEVDAFLAEWSRIAARRPRRAA